MCDSCLRQGEKPRKSGIVFREAPEVRWKKSSRMNACIIAASFETAQESHPFSS